MKRFPEFWVFVLLTLAVFSIWLSGCDNPTVSTVSGDGVYLVRDQACYVTTTAKRLCPNGGIPVIRLDAPPDDCDTQWARWRVTCERPTLYAEK